MFGTETHYLKQGCKRCQAYPLFCQREGGKVHSKSAVMYTWRLLFDKQTKSASAFLKLPSVEMFNRVALLKIIPINFSKLNYILVNFQTHKNGYCFQKYCGVCWLKSLLCTFVRRA